MKAIHFEIFSFAGYGLAILLILFLFRNRRDYWYALIGCSLAFPFEWVADNYWMFLQYDWSFWMLVDRLPLMMPFAWGWFFGIPLILCLQLQKKIDALPLWGRCLLLYVIFWPWDFVVEYASTTFGLWEYRLWPEKAMIGGILPWFIPTMVASANATLYFGPRDIASSRWPPESTGRKDSIPAPREMSPADGPACSGDSSQKRTGR